MTLIIVLAAVAVLVVIGVTQRKKLALLIRSTVKAKIDENMSTLKVLNLRISDAEKTIREMVEGAGKLFASEKQQIKALEQLKADYEKTVNEAKKAKADGNIDLAKVKIELFKELDSQITMAAENLDVIGKQKASLETRIAKIKGDIQKQKLRYEGLKARQVTNDALRSVKAETVNGETIDSSSKIIEDKIDFEQNELEYTIGDPAVADGFSEDVENEFNKL